MTKPEKQTCNWCGLTSSKLYAGLCDICLGNPAHDSEAVTKLSRQILEMRQEAKRDHKNHKNILACIADYEAHLRAYEARIRAAKGQDIDLRGLREEMGLTQAQLAERLEVTQGAVAQVEKGFRQCPKGWLEKARKAA